MTLRLWLRIHARQSCMFLGLAGTVWYSVALVLLLMGMYKFHTDVGKARHHVGVIAFTVVTHFKMVSCSLLLLVAVMLRSRHALIAWLFLAPYFLGRMPQER